jgi:hypothetical protein
MPRLIEGLRQINYLRVVAIAFLCPNVAFVLSAVTALSTEGELPRDAVEWLFSIVGSLLVLPAVVVALTLGEQSHEVLFWVSWWLSGLLWAVLIESLIFAKNVRRP